MAPTTYTAMAVCAKTVEVSQALSSTMARLPSLVNLQPPPVSAASKVASLPSDPDPQDQAMPLPLPPGPVLALPASLSDIYQCEVCDKTFSHEDNLEKHMIKHKGNRPALD